MAEQKIRVERARIEKQRLGFGDDNGHASTSHVKPKLSKPRSIAYPRCASLFGLSGDCTVYFDVTASGNAKDIFAFCSDRMFQDSAEEVVGEMIFDPATIDGVPVDYPGVVILIPFEFSVSSIEQSD
ncbi:MAG: energy transducer TonB [Pseudomonadota bacterium]